MATDGNRGERIEVRATAEEKQLLQTAASYERMDVTTFILHEVVPKARAIVERSEQIRLSERDTRRVLELLEHPPKPTPRLLRAARALRRDR